MVLLVSLGYVIVCGQAFLKYSGLLHPALARCSNGQSKVISCTGHDGPPLAHLLASPLPLGRNDMGALNPWTRETSK